MIVVMNDRSHVPDERQSIKCAIVTRNVFNTPQVSEWFAREEMTTYRQSASLSTHPVEVAVTKFKEWIGQNRMSKLSNSPLASLSDTSLLSM